MQWVFLSVAILAEVIGTAALKVSDGFTHPVPSLVVLLGYGISFFFLSLTLRTLPVGVADAVWSGAGMALIALIGWLFLKQPQDAPAIVGLVLIGAGVAVLNLCSRSIVN